MMTSPTLPIPKLTNEQQEFTQWLSKGNSLFLCSEICSDFGKVDGLETFNGHFQKRTLFRLKREGLLTETTIFEMGIRWQKLSLNERGKQLLTNCEGIAHA
ncbi:hypothetical protein [Shewanella baltica]|uniref:hypothetical protein n=1 Tax=Shewanella baltica TaxID=62322 RepID=UPI00217E28F6|nr:hypothetical protein [Shewanella baltica]MCS6095107.1 hypothetical protein [Shewanella baltica]MCS6226215.1 hypothetical protein [Shewanella baltica]